MAMLAEPRRKQKIINLRAKNNAWSKDSTKFGQRMLEKMGWTSGKGLGAHENGMTEHVVARYKNDEKGLGFEEKNDQWTKHEEDFNALLANLSNASDNTENLHSGVSLEDKSKKSKARIHYHKFTRGKDISRYSEKDLANIFGKKSFKNTQVVEERLKEDLKTTEQVFTEKGSMEDYFKNKFAAFQSKNKVNLNIKGSDCDDLDYTFCGFTQNTDDIEACIPALRFSTEINIDSIQNSILENPLCDTQKKKKKNKKSKDKNQVQSTVDVNISSHSTQVCQENVQENYECHTKIQKKKKKKSDNMISYDISDTKIYNENCTQDNAVKNYDDQVIGSKKNKKRKKIDDMNGSCTVEDPSINNSTVCNNVENLMYVAKKKKYKYKNDENTLLTDDIITEETTEVPKKKKKKKSKE